MPSNLYLSDRAASTTLQVGLGPLFNSATLSLYASTQPATANTNTSAANYILANVSFSSVAWQTFLSSTMTAATTGVLTTTAAISSGIAEFYRIYSSSGSVVLRDGSVSTSGADLNLNTNNIAAGASFTITAYTLTLPEH